MRIVFLAAAAIITSAPVAAQTERMHIVTLADTTWMPAHY